jgi:membrane-bound lytic murein transglycosylase D
MTERARRYLYYITTEVEKRGMPTEIALLPMVESAFNPDAYSSGRAVGIWQFIPSTAKNFGMTRNWWQDDRRDIISATKGALDYLQRLYDQFGDWELALAAYNWGEGAVARAVENNRKHGKPTDYASLKMPVETSNYVPTLLAIRNIIKDPDHFGLTLRPIPNRPYFTAVSPGHHIDAALVLKLADISQEEFNALNPSHNRPVILQNEDDVILLPADKADTFRTNLANYTEPLVSWQAYQSKKGERLDKVAPRFGLSLERLRSVNGLSPKATLSNGQTLLVPAQGEPEDNFEAFNTDLVPSDPLPLRALTYTVRKGDTLASIAHHHHVTAANLKKWNNGAAKIHPGQTLTIIQGVAHRSRSHKKSAQASHHVTGKKKKLASATEKPAQHSAHKPAKHQAAKSRKKAK